MSRARHATAEKEFNACKGSELRVWRESLGVGQLELANALGISQSVMCRIEHGNTGLSLYKWHVAATYLNERAGRSVKP